MGLFFVKKETNIPIKISIAPNKFNRDGFSEKTRYPKIMDPIGSPRRVTEIKAADK
jgi:hypothetical protein